MALSALQLPALEAAEVDRAVAEYLLESGRLNRQGLERAERLALSSGTPLAKLLPRLGLVGERDVALALAAATGIPLVSEREFPETPVIEEDLSPRFLREARVLPIALEDDVLRVAIADPLDRYALDALSLIVDHAIEPRIGLPAEIERGIERLYGRPEMEGAEESELAADDESLALDAERLRDLASEAPVIRLVNRVIARAAELSASDIHIEPFENELKLRYRVDGVLREAEPLPLRLRAAIASRVKIMAKLNIAEQRLPQDGRIRIALRGSTLDLRVSTVPAMHGESLVLRVLDREAVELDFAALGIVGANLERHERALAEPHGIFLVTGPTGSGKTTTLYAALSRLNRPDRKIITVEDPVEYQLAGVTQIQVKPRIGLDFANVLRSILRQDPDIILIGEIRDLETAEIAARAALTGHLVLSTLHTNDAASSLTRLLDMGLEDYLITSTLIGVAGQRLVRRLCTACRTARPVPPELARRLDLEGAAETAHFYHPVGCDACGGTGYRGRISIVETLLLDDELRRLILKRAEAREIKRAAVEAGMVSLYRDGLAKALAGITSWEEVLRVTREG